MAYSEESVVEPGASAETASSTEPIRCVAVSAVASDHPLRTSGVSAHRVTALCERPDAWLPILVSARTNHVIDGLHRLAAAERIGVTIVRAEFFHGSPAQEVCEFIRRNGDAFDLSREHRQQALREVLDEHPEWADRRISEMCGMSPKAVARVRQRIVCGDAGTTSRVGRDGRSRPVDPVRQRILIVEALREAPESSLRMIARELGVSPETVRRVRLQLEDDRNLATPCDTRSDIVIRAEAQHHNAPPRSWNDDHAFQSRVEGTETVEFLERTRVCEQDVTRYAQAVPLSRVYEIADEARRRAAVWARLADSVETRARVHARR